MGLDGGLQGVRSLDEEVDAIGYLKVGSLAQVLHPAHELAGLALLYEGGSQLGHQRGDVGTFFSNGKALFRLRPDLDLVRAGCHRVRHRR